MTDLTIDASVWIAALDEHDGFHEESQAFLAAATLATSRFIVPDFAFVEVACAIARKVRDPASGRRLAQAILQASDAVRVPVETSLVELAARVGTDTFLRGADALYVATAHLTGTPPHLLGRRADPAGRRALPN